MSVSTPPLAPDTTTSGTGARTEPHPTTWTSPAVSAHAQAFHRIITTPDYHAWLAHVRPAGGCAHPIRLRGEIATINATTGELLHLARTADMPDGVIYKACGNRRATVCPTCAEVYRRDAYHLIRTGLTGGKTIPESVATHPAVFLTLTAPSFGPVHTRRTTTSGKVLPCRPRRETNRCPHGADQRCHRLHDDTDPVLGTPICLDCYDHHHQVVWNNHAGELWRRTRIRLDRTITRLTRRRGLAPVKLRYAKVAEMQRRGVVHFHLIIRLDSWDRDQPDQILPPPAGINIDDLHQAITTSAAGTRFTTTSHPQQPGGWPIGWGTQIDIRPITLTSNGELTDTAAAGYLAKYATKSTEATGHTSRTLDTDTIDLYANPAGSHPERLIHAAWTLGSTHPTWRTLRRWAHMLGFGGHFLTKARHYSITFTHQRRTRTIWQRTQQHTDQQHDQDTTLIINWLTYNGAGWKTTGDAMLANTAAARARERREAARDAHPNPH